MVGVILGSGPVRLAGTVVVPNLANVDFILRRDRSVHGTTSSMALSEKLLDSIYLIWSCCDRVSRGAIKEVKPVLAWQGRERKEGNSKEGRAGGVWSIRNWALLSVVSHTCKEARIGAVRLLIS